MSYFVFYSEVCSETGRVTFCSRYLVQYRALPTTRTHKDSVAYRERCLYTVLYSMRRSWLSFIRLETVDHQPLLSDLRGLAFPRN